MGPCPPSLPLHFSRFLLPVGARFVTPAGLFGRRASVPPLAHLRPAGCAVFHPSAPSVLCALAGFSFLRLTPLRSVTPGPPKKNVSFSASFLSALFGGAHLSAPPLVFWPCVFLSSPSPLLLRRPWPAPSCLCAVPFWAYVPPPPRPASVALALAGLVRSPRRFARLPPRLVVFLHCSRAPLLSPHFLVRRSPFSGTSYLSPVPGPTPPTWGSPASSFLLLVTCLSPRCPRSTVSFNYRIWVLLTAPFFYPLCRPPPCAPFSVLAFACFFYVGAFAFCALPLAWLPVSVLVLPRCCRSPFLCPLARCLLAAAFPYSLLLVLTFEPLLFCLCWRPAACAVVLASLSVVLSPFSLFLCPPPPSPTFFRSVPTRRSLVACLPPSLSFLSSSSPCPPFHRFVLALL